MKRTVLAFLALTLLSAPASGSSYFLPQLAIGSSGDLQIRTLLTISTPTTSPVNATIILGTCRDEGSPWVVTWEAPGRPALATTDSYLSFALLPGETVTLLAKSSGPLTTGWIMGRSSCPVVMTLRYSVARVSGGVVDPQWEVGVLPSAALNEHFVFVAQGASNWGGCTTSTALAIGNTSDQTATLTLKLHAADFGNLLGTRTMTIPGRGHVARFVPEIFTDVVFSGSFQGMLHISANTALAVMTLQDWGTSTKSVYASAGVLPFHEATTNLCFDVEPSDYPGMGEIIEVPSELVGVLQSASDGPETDFFRMYLEAGHTLGVMGLGDLTGSSLSPQVAVLGEDEQVLATGSGVLGAFGASALQLAITKTGWYNLRVSSPTSNHGRQHFYRVFVGQK